MKLQPTLTRQHLKEFLDSGVLTTTQMHLLRWPVFLPFLSVEEFTQLMQRPQRPDSIFLEQKTVASHLHRMETVGILNHIILNEPDVTRQYRYYLTDLGLYIFAASFDPPFSVERLVDHYPVDHDTLLLRLVHPQVHLILTDFARRLLTENSDYTLISWQYPYHHQVESLAQRYTIQADAAFLLKHPSGSHHAFFVKVDVGIKHRKDRQELAFLTRLLDMRQRYEIHRSSWPGLLILTTVPRLSLWSQLLWHSSQLRQRRIIAGGITTFADLQKGVYAPIWYDLTTFIDQGQPQPRRTLAQLLIIPATSDVIEHLSQHILFDQLLIERDSGLLIPSKRQLPLYVKASLQEQAGTISADDLQSEGLSKSHEGRTKAGQLTLVLSAPQKELLLWLARHPFLTPRDLLTLLPKAQSVTRLRQFLNALIDLKLVYRFIWNEGNTWTEKERYLLTKQGLEYLTLRYDLLVSEYFVPSEDRKNEGPLWIQRGVAGLYHQMKHTSDLYQCISSIIQYGTQIGDVILDWKSAGEAYRSQNDPVLGRIVVRPDAELVYIHTQTGIPTSVLIEYDRGTSFEREYVEKFSAYFAYQNTSEEPLPPILMVAAEEQRISKMHQVASSIATNVIVVIMPEVFLQQHSLNDVLREASPGNRL